MQYSQDHSYTNKKPEIKEPYDKENLSHRANYPLRRDKKFAYAHNDVASMQRNHPSKNKQNYAVTNEMSEIEILKQELKEQRQKVKYLQSRTIQQQCSVLQHLETLQEKFQQLASEKYHLEIELQKTKDTSRTESEDSAVNWKHKFDQLESQHKKIKKIGQSLINMMKKVDGVEGDVKDAWHWVKKVVWEYESIRHKAMEWRQVYQQVTQAVTIIGKTQHP